MSRSPEGTPRRSPLTKAKDVLRRVDRKAVKGVVGAGIALGSVSLEAALPASASVSSKAHEAMTASPAQNSRFETPDQVVKSIQAELAAKDNKPKKDKDSEEAQGVTTTTRKEQKEINKQIAEIAGNIEAVYDMTPEEFQAWGEANPMTQSGTAPWDFPFLRGASFPTTNVDTNNRTITYSNLPGSSFPWGPHLSLFTLEPTFDGGPNGNGLIGSLLIVNGTITSPIVNEENGQKTITFGTQIWPDGTKTTIAWTNNVQAPNNPLLGPSHTYFTDQVIVQKTFNQGSLGIELYQRSLQEPQVQEELLNASINKPAIVFFLNESGVRNMWYNFGPDGSLQYNADAHIEGVEVNPQYAAMESLAIASLSGDQEVFQNEVKNGISSGNISTSKKKGEIKKWVEDRLSTLTLGDVFKKAPLGITTFIENATPLISKSASVGKSR